jgi:DNA uptake protein ComE-like DNA-binding protein
MFCLSGILAVGIAAGCGLVQSDNQTEEQKKADADKTRDEVAKATERAKPELEKAGQELKEAAKTAADQAHAAAQGVKEGWEKGKDHRVDLNSADESELATLPGVTRWEARKIIAGRPYGSPHELVEKGIISGNGYAEIRDRVEAK